LLRLVMAGSVDDGKSTLIGRLLYETQGLFDDELEAVRGVCRKRGIKPGELDFSLFTDGLRAEREQCITIDVAHRHWSTPRRRFLILDAPGHEQYVRNMATGASAAQLAVILVDAAKGIVTQTRRHAAIAALMGIRQIVLVVNKMDLAGFSQAVFEHIRDEFRQFVQRLDVSVTAVPVCATQGDNLTRRSPRTPWYGGEPLKEHLETIDCDDGAGDCDDLRFPIQYVSRSDSAGRTLLGSAASGMIREGDEVVVLPSGSRGKVRRVIGLDGSADQIAACQPCGVMLEDHLDVSRGCLLARPGALPHVGAGLRARLVWLSGERLKVAQPYYLKHTTRLLLCEVTAVAHRLDVDTLDPHPADTLEANEIGLCDLRAHQPLVFDRYSQNRATGSFILIDRLTHETVAGGVIMEPLPAEPLGRAQAACLAIGDGSTAQCAEQIMAGPYERGIAERRV
jgi:sulfate adenylyltransferase large subunit